MRNLKKVLTLVLAIVMVVGCLAIGAGAAYTDDAAITYDDAVSTLTGLGVFEGTDGAFNPKANLTRQEVAKIVAMTLTGGTLDPTLYEDAKIFTDVDGLWGEGYINYLAGQGIASGHAGKYNPQDPVTAQELAKFMLVALGYPAELFTGDNWAANINRVAAQAGLYTDYIGSYAKALTREEAALILYNGLMGKVVVAQWDSNITNLGTWNWKWETVDNPNLGGTQDMLGIEKYFNCSANVNEAVYATGAEVVELKDNAVVVTLGGGYAIGTYEGKVNDKVTVYTHNKTGDVVCIATYTPEVTPDKLPTITTTTKMTAPAAEAAMKAAGFTKANAEAYADEVAAFTQQGIKIVFKQGNAGTTGYTQLDSTGIYYKVTKVAVPYIANVSGTTYTLTALDVSNEEAVYVTDGADYSFDKDAAKNTQKFYKYDSFVKDAYYTVSETDTSAAFSAVTLKYGTYTPVVTIAPMATVASVVGDSYTNTTVTLGGKAYALSYLNGLLASGAQTVGAVYEAGLSKAANGTVVGANLVLDGMGNIVAASAAGAPAKSSDYIYIFDAAAVVEGVGGIFSKYTASVEAITDDGAYGAYEVALTLNTTTNAGHLYSGANDLGTTADAVMDELAGNDNPTRPGKWWSYTIDGNTITLIDAVSTDVVETTAKYEVETGKVAPSAITIKDEGVKLITDATEFVYFNDPGANKDTKVVSVTKAAAITIANSADATVIVDYADVDETIVAKIIVIGATYGSGTDNKYVYVDIATMSATKVGAEYVYTYATTDAAGQPGTVSTKAPVAVSAVYALNKDGTLSSTVANADTFTSRTGNIVQLDDGYFALAEGVEPVLTKATLKVEADATVYYTVNTAGYINGLWVVAPGAVVGSTPLSTTGTFAAIFDDADDGLYTLASKPTGIDCDGDAAEILYFKCDPSTAQVLTIKAGETTVYIESVTTGTVGVIYLQFVGEEVATDGNASNWQTATKGLPAGNYTYTITGGTAVSGSFVIA
ncbi:MAG: S-layer homology domain-containing protein [Oscillospiraceae bacterium]|nr:S-layer homology domain-containing protein [Oscillospiraceae bacterium]